MLNYRSIIAIGFVMLSQNLFHTPHVFHKKDVFLKNGTQVTFFLVNKVMLLLESLMKKDFNSFVDLIELCLTSNSSTADLNPWIKGSIKNANTEDIINVIISAVDPSFVIRSPISDDVPTTMYSRTYS